MATEHIRQWEGELGVDHGERKVFTQDEMKAAMERLGSAVAMFVEMGCPGALVQASLAALSGVLARDHNLCQCEACHRKHKELVNVLYSHARMPNGRSRGGLIL